jgi:hypothetical protein
MSILGISLDGFTSRIGNAVGKFNSPVHDPLFISNLAGFYLCMSNFFFFSLCMLFQHCVLATCIKFCISSRKQQGVFTTAPSLGGVDNCTQQERQQQATTMPHISKRTQLVCDLFFLYVISADNKLNEIFMSRRHPSSPSTKENKLLKWLSDDVDDLSILIQVMLSSCYLVPRTKPIHQMQYDIAQLFQMPDNESKQAVRTSESGFMALLREISHHKVFGTAYIVPQLPVPHQVALTLERLGSYGNRTPETPYIGG